MGELSYTVGGDSNLVSFKSAARVPITSLKARFKPKQDLHGYSKPWPAGGGKNLFDKDDETLLRELWPGNDVLHITDDKKIYSIVMPCSPNVSYTLSKSITTNVFACCYITEEPAEGTVVYGRGQNESGSVTVTTGNDAKYLICWFYNARYANNPESSSIEEVLDTLQIEKGSAATSYEPYENICPIEGWNGCEVYLSSQYLPEEYQEVEYLEGKNALIDLDYIIKTDPLVKVTMSIKNEEDRDIMGFYNNIVPSFIINPAPNSKRWYNRYYLTSGLDFSSVPPIVGEKNTWEFGNVNKKNGNIIHIRYAETSEIDWSSNTQTFYLFGARNVHKDIIIYDFKLYDGSTLVRNLVPCYRKLDNEPGMYDIISQTFFTNQYTGEFICGPDIGQTIPITFPVLGKNKLSDDINDYVNNVGAPSAKEVPADFKFANGEYSGTVELARDYCVHAGKNLYDPGTYTISFDYINGGQNYNWNPVICSYHNDGNWYSTFMQYALVANEDSGHIERTFTTTQPFYVHLTLNTHGVPLQSATNKIYNLQLELGPTATTYESYSPNNTIYGGYIDPAAGEAVVTHYVATIDENSTIIQERTQNKVKTIIYELPYNGSSDSNALLTNGYGIRERNSASWNYPQANKLYLYPDYNVTTSVVIGIPSKSMSQADWTDWLEENGPIQFYYKLATPIHYPLSKTQFQTYLNSNAVWSNTNDVTEVSYAIHDTAPIRAAKERMLAFAAKKEEEIRVPSAYRKLQYISAVDSNPYITTSITYPNELEAEVHFYNTKTEAFVFGARNDISKKPYCNLNISSEADKIRFDYGDYKYHVSTTGKTGEKIFKFHNRVGTMIHVDTSTTRTYSYDTAVFTSYTTNPLLLFAVNTNGSPSLGDSQGELRMYSAKFWVGGKLVGNFLPCKRKSDDVVGMYDTITKQFYTSTNTDTFTAGPVA